MKNSAFAKIIMVTGVLGLTACGGSDRDETGSVPPEPVADAMVQKSVEELTLLDVNNLALNAASIQILSDEEWQKVQAGNLKTATNAITADDSEQLLPPINSLPTATYFKGQSYLANAQGIVQGMSGSPILQNGRLVGAVTHVLVNDPTRGYGIFAQTMLEQAKNAVQNGAEAQTAE